MGRKEALPRIAHLLCEMFLRMQAVGLTTEQSCPLPITQTDMSDALGLTSVHVNRVLRDLRHQELIALDHRMLTILDWPGLTAWPSLSRPTCIRTRADRTELGLMCDHIDVKGLR